MLPVSRLRRFRPLVATVSAAVVMGVFVGPGVAQAVPAPGDPDCLTEEYVPESGVALSAVMPPVAPVPGPRYPTTYAYGVGTDRQVWYRPVTGPLASSAGWQSLGGVSLYGPAAVFSGTTSYVLVTGGDGAVYMRANSGSGWGGWTSLGGYVVSSPAVASLGAGHLRVAAAGADGALWTQEFAGGRWSGWYSLGGGLASAPVATAYPSYGQVEVAVMGTDGLTYTVGLGSGARSGTWIGRDLPTCSTLSSPSVSKEAFAGDRVYLDYDRSLRKVNTPRLYGVPENSLGGFFTANPDVEYNAISPWSLTIAGIGADGALWVNESGLTNDWRSLGGQLR